MKTEALVQWYEENRRELPWREVRDPYFIWISEVILQQTRVVQGLDYYHRFTERFPSVKELASATEDEVLLYWQGLGYYSRARNLHAAAKQVMERHNGIFPTDYHELKALKGVGDYTAAAVSSFSSEAPFAVVDGNVYRVLSRLFDIDTPIDSTKGKKEFAELAQHLLEEHMKGNKHTESSLFNQGMMELGSLVCTPKSPDCPNCPVTGYCLARQNKTTDQRPVKFGKTKQRIRHFHYLHLTDPDGNTLLARRNKKDIWQGLYEFPLIETETPLTFDALEEKKEFNELLKKDGYTLIESIAMPKHILSHQVIHAVFHRLSVSYTLAPRENRTLVSHEKISEYAVSRLTDLYLTR